MNDPPRIVPTRSDIAVANEIRDEGEAALKVMVDVMNRANAQGFRLDFQVGRDQGGRVFQQPIVIAKYF